MTTCPHCGRQFDPDDARWNLPYCSTVCRLAVLDEARAAAGPDNPPVVDHLDGGHEPITGAARRAMTLNQRLTAGFAMLQGEHRD